MQRGTVCRAVTASDGALLVSAPCEYEKFSFDCSLCFSGGSSTANLLQALEEYLPVLLGLVKESERPTLYC